MIGDRDEAQECVQEAFVRAWSRRGSLSRAEHPEAWIRTTAYRLRGEPLAPQAAGRRPADRALSPTTAAPATDESRVALVAGPETASREAAPGAGCCTTSATSRSRPWPGRSASPKGPSRPGSPAAGSPLAALLAPTDTTDSGAHHV